MAAVATAGRGPGWGCGPPCCERVAHRHRGNPGHTSSFPASRLAFQARSSSPCRLSRNWVRHSSSSQNSTSSVVQVPVPVNSRTRCVGGACAILRRAAADQAGGCVRNQARATPFAWRCCNPRGLSPRLASLRGLWASRPALLLHSGTRACPPNSQGATQGLGT